MRHPNYKQWNVVCRHNDYKDNSDDYNKIINQATIVSIIIAVMIMAILITLEGKLMKMSKSSTNKSYIKKETLKVKKQK